LKHSIHKYPQTYRPTHSMIHTLPGMFEKKKVEPINLKIEEIP